MIFEFIAYNRVGNWRILSKPALAGYCGTAVVNERALGSLEYGITWLNYADESDIGILTRRMALHNARANVDCRDPRSTISFSHEHAYEP